MKTNNIPKAIFALIIVLLISCSKTEENTPIVNIESLLLTSDSMDNVLVDNETINFTVTGDDGEIYNDQATIYVDLAPITGTSHTFTGVGPHDVYASFAGISSNTISFNVVSATENTLLISDTKLLRNQTNTFSLINPQGDDVSATATFYVDGNAIPGNQYVSASVGTHEIYATYDLAGTLQTTPTQSFEIFIPKRKVVIEDYTGAWCGWCPRAIVAVQAAHDATDDIAVVAIHETSFTFPDPMHFDDIQILKDAFNVNGNPAVRLNRTTTWIDPDYPLTSVTNTAGEETDIAIAIKSQLTGNSLTVDVKAISETGLAMDDKLVVYLLEDSILYDQVNYYNTDPTSPFFNLGNPIPNFEHNEVLRLSLSQVLGDTVTETSSLEEYNSTYTAMIPAEYNADNLTLVAMIVSADNTARNAQTAHVGEDKEYE
jgi:thiol-disulfide isomerase/thioredoxin